ncbi:MAG: response regulator transcription factor [Firmicutes bacterium]|nr:response regulator transcription factor [Bacillota bacterium]
METKILVVDDDPNIREVIRLYLERAGYRLDLAADGPEALAAFRRGQPDLVVLDLMLPGIDGWRVCETIRAESDCPVIMLTARGEPSERVEGFRLGADDYVVKPFDPNELVARIQAVLRRAGSDAGSPQLMRFGDLEIDPQAYALRRAGRVLKLPPREFELLCFMTRHPNRVFTREELLSAVWGYDYPGDTRTVDVHVSRLRDKLGPDGDWYVATVHGIGYQWRVRS